MEVLAVLGVLVALASIWLFFKLVKLALKIAFLCIALAAAAAAVAVYSGKLELPAGVAHGP